MGSRLQHVYVYTLLIEYLYTLLTYTAVPIKEVASGIEPATCRPVENATAVTFVEAKEHHGEGYYSDVLQEHSQKTSMNMLPSSCKQTTWSNRSIE
jgi:hypothetical protein